MILEGNFLNQLDERIKTEVVNDFYGPVLAGESYLVQYQLDQKWYRAKVMNCVTGW